MGTSGGAAGIESMAKPKIAVITRPARASRFGEKPAKWIYGVAAARADMSVELIDLREYPMPFFDEPASNDWVPSKNEAAQRWQKKVAEFDGYIFVTADYNRGLPAVLKNALDYAYPEWNRKAAAYVGYGSVGVPRSIEHLRLTCVELQMAPTHAGVHLQGADFLMWQQGKDIKELSYLEQNSKAMLDELQWWASALMVARALPNENSHRRSAA
jgi:NAD(P)H-dependent FMN reductase